MIHVFCESDRRVPIAHWGFIVRIEAWTEVAGESKSKDIVVGVRRWLTPNYFY